MVTRKGNMNIKTTLEIINKYSKCQICVDETVGNGSKLDIDDSEFLRTCRECGWEVKGIVDDNEEIIETYNSASQVESTISTEKKERVVQILIRYLEYIDKHRLTEESKFLKGEDIEDYDRFYNMLNTANKIGKPVRLLINDIWYEVVDFVYSVPDDDIFCRSINVYVEEAQEELIERSN